MGTFEVIEPGPFSTIQDAGRFYYSRVGIAASGPMDSFSFRIGNILVGNSEGEAALEVTVFGPKLKVLKNACIAITGGDLGFYINNVAARRWEAVEVRSGDIITSKGLTRGCRAYIAIGGGIDVPEVMGSKSTCIPYHIGGIEGRALKKGDIIKTGRSQIDLNNIVGRRISREIGLETERILPDHRRVNVLRVVMGPFENHFTSESKKTFLSSEYITTPLADRIAYMLEGPEIRHNSRGPDIVASCGHMPGAIQVPGSFRPIIFLHERAGGGYAVIGTVISSDLNKIGQLKPGDRIRFEKVSIREAQCILKQYENAIKLFKSRLDK